MKKKNTWGISNGFWHRQVPLKIYGLNSTDLYQLKEIDPTAKICVMDRLNHFTY